MKNKINQAELVRHLREDLGPPCADLTDGEILSVTEGTYTRARVEQGIAITKLKKAFKKAIDEDFPFIKRMVIWLNTMLTKFMCAK